MTPKEQLDNEYELLVQQLFDELMELCAPICKTEADAEEIRKAFYFAKDAHKGVKRKSGEPYITHPLSVATIVVKEIRLGVKSVISALLHDVVEDTEYELTDIEHRFGPKIASMVDGLTKLGGVFDTNISEQAENFKKMLLTLSDDARVILIKIADRLHNMRTLHSMPPHKQMKIASETLYLFAPLAHRLGLYSIKSELEDTSLKYRFPDEYNEIAEKLSHTEEERKLFIAHFIKPIKDELDESGIEAEITGRIKSVYSIWKKMEVKKLTFEEIFDLSAIRIVFKATPLIPEKSQCWYVYSLVTDIYKPKPDRIRDWVNIPKVNGYEALHSTVMSKEGVWVEVQIRSERMNDIAEHGFAAHWKYKTRGEKGVPNDEYDPWLLQLREALQNPSDDAVEFMDNIKLNLKMSDIVVFTPKGESRTIPKNSTVLDFAYAIHSKIGDSALGAKVNYKPVPLSTQLKSGDQVEIITSSTSQPKLEWLDMATTAKAMTHIKNHLKKETENNIKHGQNIFETEIKRLGIVSYGSALQKLLPAYECATKDQFYSKLGTGIIPVEGIEKALKENTAVKLVKYWTLQLTKPFKPKNNTGNSKHKSKVSDEKEPKFIVAECCNPIPGDKIIGFKKKNSDIEVHKTSCHEAIKMSSQLDDSVVDPKWSTKKIMSYLTVIEIRGIDRMGLLFDLAKVISSELNANIRSLNFQSHDGIFTGKISLYVRNQENLKLVIDRAYKVKGVEKIIRLESKSID